MINNLFPTPVYYSSIDEEILKRLQKDITEYVKNNGDLFKTAVWKCNTETNIFCEEKKAFFNKIQSTWKGRGAKKEQVSELTDAQKKLPPALQKAIEKKDSKKKD